MSHEAGSHEAGSHEIHALQTAAADASTPADVFTALLKAAIPFIPVLNTNPALADIVVGAVTTYGPTAWSWFVTLLHLNPSSLPSGLKP